MGGQIYQIYLLSKISENLIWFVLGMLIAVLGIEKLKRPALGVALGLLFIGLSVLLYWSESVWIPFGLGLLACIAVLMIAIGIKELKVLVIAATYTMPVFLMHTLFAAPVRTILIKMGISNSVVHVVIGIMISFLGPVVAMKVLQMMKLDWLVYPGRQLKKRK